MEAFCPGLDQQKWRRTLVLICDSCDDGLGQTGSSVLCFFGDESLGSEPQSLHYCQGYIFCGAGERN